VVASQSNKPPPCQPLPLATPTMELPADDEQFDWSCGEGISLVPSLFRPSKPESPVDIDHSGAVVGLAGLGCDELEIMATDMALKFNRLYRVLVDALEERDNLIAQLDVKNTFVAALLRVSSAQRAGGDENNKVMLFMH